MAETTGIGWTDATQNFWEGCTKVGPGCDHCYAEARDERWHGGSHWGSGAPRRRVVPATFARPLAWNIRRLKYELALTRGEKWPIVWTIPPQWVFALSLGDFFDNEVPEQWRTDAWAIIRECRSLRWQIVTKRIGNVPKMLPADWDEGRNYPHVGIIATIVTQAELDRDGPKLREAKRVGVRWVGASCEPLLEPLRLDGWDDVLDWVICGGESGTGARPFSILSAIQLQAQCRQAGIPFFLKQMGDNAHGLGGKRIAFKAPAGADPAEWSPSLRQQEMPAVYGDPIDRAARYR